MKASELYRYERKFVAPLDTAEAVALVKRHPALFFEEYPARWINNVYWDAPGLPSVRDNVRGVANREKVRVRWYGDAVGTIERPVLERKIKRGVVGCKRSASLSSFEMREGRLARELARMLERSSLAAEHAAKLAHRRPVLVNRYRRRYFRSADRRFRITIDERMSYLGVRPLETRFVGWAHDRETVLLELKYAREEDPDASRITRHLPARISRSSKYVTGMQLICPALRG